jgi:nitrilase
VLAEGEGVVQGVIDLEYMEGVRDSLPALKHRTM